MLRLTIGLAFLTLAWTSTWVLAATNLVAGAAAYRVCGACHGANGEGNDALSAPRLAGREAWSVTRQLLQFRNGARGTAAADPPGAQMRAMALTLASEDAVADVSAYIATLESPAAVVTLRGDVTRGKRLFSNCVICHGANAGGSEALHAPRLAGQQDWYLAAQLHNFRSGKRGADPRDTIGAQMAPIAQALPDDQAVIDVAAYIASLL